MTTTRTMLAAVALWALVPFVGCGGASRSVSEPTAATVRREGRAATDGETVGRWLLAELISKGADAAYARAARAKLAEVPHRAMFGALALGMYEGAHGHARAAAEAYLDAVVAARGSRDPRAPLVAWYATNHLLGLVPSTTGYWDAAKDRVEQVIKSPGSVGWRARGELVEWWGEEARSAGMPRVADRLAERHGCLDGVRLSGPFGRGVAADRRRAFAAELPGGWPRQFAPDDGIHERPRVLRTERLGCQIRATEPVGDGIFYAETFVDLPADRDVILAVQGAYRIVVDDVVVLERDTRVWGVWTQFGVRLRLARGRHRIVARTGSPDTSVRLLAPDGAPAGVASSRDPAPGYEVRSPTVLPDPNVLDGFVHAGSLVPTIDDVSRFLAAYLAHIEGQDDVAAVMLEPLVADAGSASGFVLAAAATVAEKDPIFPDADRHDLARDLRQKAVAKDKDLWWARFWLALDQAEKKGLADAVSEVRKLAAEVPEAPEVLEGLLDLYQRLGWKAERSLLARDLGARFPDSIRVLREVLAVLDDQAEHAEADRVAERIQKLDPDGDIAVERALRRHDYRGATTELKRLGTRRPDRKDLADTLAEVLTKAGERPDALPLLERAVAKRPHDAAARLRLADARFASGDRQALRRARSDSILAGADSSELLAALELVEGVTELEPYRLDGAKVIRQYEASGEEMEGTAARVLDYSAIWVHPDGSSRMLEHELIRVQSQEAIGKMAEQRVPEGLVLKMRVLKQDGSVLEPEFVAGKATATMPHLEEGDYIETESITSRSGDSQFGTRYLGPHWFFREADVAYWRSEIVIVTPADKSVVIEHHGDVPPPAVTHVGPLSVRRFRVDKSPAAPSEPGSPPIQEFLPSVRAAWGIDLVGHVKRLADELTDELARDPRLVRIALGIAPPEADVAVRARKLYRWVVANVEDGREEDGRRVVVGKAGSRTSAFVYLCRTLGIPVEHAVVKDRLAPPPVGPVDETEAYDQIVVRLGTTPAQWLTVSDKFAPFGYLPGPLRGQPAFRLVPGTPRDTTSAEGSRDGVLYDATGELLADGSATLELAQRFVGKAGISLRNGLQQIPSSQWKDVVEGRLLAQAIPGARLVSLRVENQGDLDQPITMRMKITVRDFARRRGNTLVLTPPFAIRISQLTGLPYRQTPLLLSDPTYASIRLVLRLPKGAAAALPGAADIRDGDRAIAIRDRQEGAALVLDRVVSIPAGRVRPDEYKALQQFARQGDDATMRDVVIQLP